MILPPWDNKLQTYDRFKEFAIGVSHQQVELTHYYQPSFVQLATGELISTLHSWGPEQRKTYRLLGLSVVDTTDTNLPDLFHPSGEHLPKAWLGQGGMQQLLIDHSTRRVVRLDQRDHDYLTQNIPSRFVTKQGYGNPPDKLVSTVSLYFAGEGRLPVGSPVTVSRPVQAATTPQEREFIRETRDVARALVALTEGSYRSSETLPFERIMNVMHASELTDAEQRALAANGVGRAVEKVPYLLVEEGYTG